MVENKDMFGSVLIPEDWDLMPLGKCVTEKLSYGINAPAIPFDGKSPSYIRITDITEDGRFDDSDRKAVMTQERDKYLLHEGDIVLARTGASTGKSYLYDERDGELVYAGFLIKASVNTARHNPRFIVGQLRTPRYWSWVAAMSMRSGQPGINGKEYSSFLVPVAPKKEQDAIADTLVEFDTHIINLSELIEKKKAIRDGALEDLVSGRTRLPGFSGTWKESKLLDHVSLIQGLTYTPENVVPHGVLVLRSSNIQDGFLSLTDTVYVNSRISEDQFVQAGDILICVRNGSSALIGKSCVLPQMPNTTFGAFMSILRGDNTGFISQAFKSEIIQEQVRGKSNATINQITKKDFKSITLKMPGKQEQIAIADVLTAMDDEITALEDERNKMIQIREGAMDDLLTGRVRLSI